MALAFYNTLTKKIEAFSPIKKGEATLYHCGPTVYNYAHIGNFRSYIFADTLRRVLELEGFSVKQVINITDIGHLSGDTDDGEDKMVKALKREGKPMTLASMREVADFYKEKFIEDLKRLRILLPQELPHASDHIQEDIEIISLLEQKGYVYKTSDGLYFDTAKMLTYGALGGVNKDDDLQTRIGENSEKHSPRDFVLWKFSTDASLGYESPWGIGFPGWHIECSGMSRHFLGQPFDIHTGGIDHIAVHHNNEIAQSECAYDCPLAHVWMHNSFVNINGEKIAKSLANEIYIKDLTEKGVRPESYRLWLLMAHYRSPVNFTWEALIAADTAVSSLYELFLSLPEGEGSVIESYKTEFLKFIEDDLDTPKAVALLFNLIKDTDIKAEDKRTTILYMDRVFCLGFSKLEKISIPDHVKLLSLEREKARAEKDWAKADELRAEIEKAGFIVRDGTDTVGIFPNHLSPISELAE